MFNCSWIIHPKRLISKQLIEEVGVLKNEVKDKDLQSLMLAILTDEEEEAIDPKS